MTSSNPKIVACVLRSGGVYTTDYVNRLANSVNRNLTIPYHFVCLTDLKDGFNENVHEVIPLRHDYPGWWAKVELFRSDLYKDRDWFFLDLDTVIIDNIDDLVGSDHSFTALEDFYRGEQMGSGLMAWKQRWYNFVYCDFAERPERVMDYCLYGDQQWIKDCIKGYESFQSKFPGAVVSFKKHCTRSAKDITVPNGAKIICFHGTPKPHEATQLITIKENWK